MMNRQAQAWGLKNTQFKNVTGLTEPGHYSSARDMARDRRAHHRRLPRLLPLLLDPRVHLQQDPAGQPQHAARPRPGGRRHEDRLHRGRRLLPDRQRAARLAGWQAPPVSVVLGTASREARANESQKLLNWGYAPGTRCACSRPARPVATVPVWKGKLNEAARRAGAACSSPCPRARAQAEDRDRAHRPAGRTAGQGPEAWAQLKVTTPPARGGEVPLVVLEAVTLAGLFGRAWDAIRLWIK
jgi:D-alanyl-D-alanine carboxypeptidase (penicillin-binding protein 5/6)